MRPRFLGSLRLYSTKKKASAKKKTEEEPPQVMLSADALGTNILIVFQSTYNFCAESTEDLRLFADFLSRSFLRGGIKSAVHPEFGIGSIQNQLEKYGILKSS
jgi:hypothetical protein